MSTIKGHAFEPDEAATAARRMARFRELSAWRRVIIKEAFSEYGKNVYHGEIPLNCPNLSDEDVAIICDDGNVCFGGHVEQTGTRFSCTIWTD